MDVRRARLLAALALVTAALAAALAVPAGSSAQTPSPGSTAPRTAAPGFYPKTPEGYEISARKAVRIAGREPAVAEESATHGRLTTAVQTIDGGWQVGYSADGDEVVQVKLDGQYGAVFEVWTGYQVAWPMARGYESQFGHVLNAPYVWLPLCLVFLLGLIDWRRPLRIVHLDLLVLLAFGVSHIFFNRGEIGVSVPLTYPPLVYLLVRCLWLGLRGGEGLRPSVPTSWLAIAAVFLIAFRITINVADSGVIDVGYAGTIGADRITHGEPVWGEGEFPDDNRFGDTYGPVNYFAYIPFELVLPWSGSWDDLPASHGAALFFDLAAIAGLFAFGVRLRRGPPGRRLGIVLAFAWVAYPYTDFALQSNSNDSLLAALLAWSLALFARPVVRGALLGLAALAKFAPLALAPLYATGERGLLERWSGRRRSPAAGLRPVLAFTLALVGVGVLMLAHPAIDPGLATFWDRTIAKQIDRESPFSIWGQVAGLGWLHSIVIAFTAGLAIGVAFVPRRRSIGQIAALAAAVVIATELTADHWFYLYIPWFFAPLAIALAVPRPPLRESAAG